jgi:hypothetical protein
MENKMTINIEIIEETETYDDMADLLRHIADQIEEGYRSGIFPSWSTEGEEEQNENENNNDIL